jgi:hypothetical protein
MAERPGLYLLAGDDAAEENEQDRGTVIFIRYKVENIN